MKIRNVATIVLLSIMAMPLMAQKSTIKEITGAPYEGTRNGGLGWKNMFKGGFMHDNTNYAVSVEYNARAFYFWFYIAATTYTSNMRLYKLDGKMNVDEVNNISLMPNKQMVNFHSYQVVGDNLFIFFEYKNRKDKKYYFFCKKYGIVDHEEQIYKVAERPFHGKGEKIQFTVNVSPDRKKLSIVTNYLKKERKAKTTSSSGSSKKKIKNTTTFDYVVLDEDMSVLSSGAKVKLDANESETVWEYDIMPNGQLLVVSTEVVDFKEEAGATKSKTKPVKGVKTKTPKDTKAKFARRYYLNLYDDEDVTRIAVDEEKYQRGFYSLPLSDSTIQVFSYFTENGKTTDGLMHSTLNLKTKSLEDHEFATFSEIKGAAGVAKDDDVGDDEEDAKATKKTKAKAKKAKTKGKGGAKFDNVVKNLYTISYVDRLKDGSLVVFGEIYSFYVQVYTTYSPKYGTQTTYVYHYVYGPAGMVKIDSSGAINSSTVVDYKVDNVNYDPGFAGIPMAVGKNGYVVVTNNGYSLIDFGKPTNSMKNFTSINNGVGKRGSGEITRAGDMVLMVLTKKRSVTFSTLGTAERGAGGTDKKKKKKK